MTRRRRTALAILTVTGLLGLGGWVLLRISSGAEFVAGAIGAVLGRPVQVESVRLRAGGRLEMELHGVLVLDVPGGKPLLEVERLVAHVDWPRLLAGQFVPASWTLVKPVLRVGADGESRPLEPRLPLRPMAFTVRDGTLLWGDPSNGGYRLVHVEASARSRAVPGILRGTALGQVQRSGQTMGSYSIEFDAGFNHIDLRGTLAEWELEALAPEGWQIAGRASGTVSARLEPDGPRASFDLTLDGLRVSHPDLGSPIAPHEAHALVEVRWEPEVVEVRLEPLALDDFAVRGMLRMHEDGERRIVAELKGDEFEVGGPGDRLQLLRLLGHRFATFEAADRRSKGGRIRVDRIWLDVPRDRLAATLSFTRKNDPREIGIHARIRDGFYEPDPDQPPLEQIDAEMRIEGNRLEVYDLRMKREGRALPEIDVTVRGLHRLFHLPQEERRIPAGPGEPLAGLGPAFDALAGPPDPDRPSTPVVFENVKIGYPAFLLPIRDATAVLSLPEGNLALDDMHGVVGGAPATARALWDRANDRVIVDVAYTDEKVTPREPVDSPWLEAELRTDLARITPWVLESVTARVRGEGARLDLWDVRAELAGGRLLAEAELDLSRDGEAPVRVTLDLADAEAERVAVTLAMQKGTCEGRLAASGTLEGPLVPDTPFLARGRLDLEVRVEDGKLGNLPVTVTLARLASPLGWTGLFGRPLPFATLEMDLRSADGILRISDFSLEGPEIRILAAGQIDVVSDERPLDLLVALLFFQSVDRVIGTVPVIGDWVLGKNRNLMAVYFRLEGPWEAPSGRYVPPETLRTASGWAERVIVGGVRGLGRLLRPGAAPKAEVEGPPETEPEVEPVPEGGTETGTEAGPT